MTPDCAITALEREVNIDAKYALYGTWLQLWIEGDA